MFSLLSYSFSIQVIVMKTHQDKTENQCKSFLNPWPEPISRNSKSHWSIHALCSPALLWLHFSCHHWSRCRCGLSRLEAHLLSHRLPGADCGGSRWG